MEWWPPDGKGQEVLFLCGHRHACCHAVHVLALKQAARLFVALPTLPPQLAKTRSGLCPANAAASCRNILGRFTETGCAVHKLKSLRKLQSSWSIHRGSFAIDCKACASRNEPVARSLSEPRSRVAIQTCKADIRSLRSNAGLILLFSRISLRLTGPLHEVSGMYRSVPFMCSS